ncbi:hypothetical protein [uncultured Anaerococcus sp.]|nr:hypothetical protein [uncultured Anaerococcus sp.]
MKSNRFFIKLSAIIFLNILLLAPFLDKDGETIDLSTNTSIYLELV